MTDHNVGSPMMQSNLRSQTPVMNQANQNNSNSQSGMHPPHQVSAILNSLRRFFIMEFLTGRSSLIMIPHIEDIKKFYRILIRLHFLQHSIFTVGLPAVVMEIRFKCNPFKRKL